MRIAANSAVEMDEREFETIPEGVYPCRVLDVLAKKSSQGGVYWSIKNEIQSGPYAGKFIWDNLFFSPKALNRFFLVWKRLTGMELDRTKDIDVEEGDLIGCKANVTVVHKQEVYEGKTKTRAKVSFEGYSDYDESVGLEKNTPKASVKDDSDEIPF